MEGPSTMAVLLLLALLIGGGLLLTVFLLYDLAWTGEDTGVEPLVTRDVIAEVCARNLSDVKGTGVCKTEVVTPDKKKFQVVKIQ